MYHPPEIDGTNDNTLDEFIELRNITSEPVPLYETAWPIHTWKITGGVEFTFPQDVTLGASEYVLLVNFNPADATQRAAFQTKYGVGTGVRLFGPYSGKLNNDGDDLELKKPTLLPLDIIGNVLVDEVEYKDAAPWPAGADGFGLSLQRQDIHAYGNEPANWLAALPTAAAGTPAGGTPPTLTTQPVSQSVVAYSPVTLSASASGDAPLLYQWRLNGEYLPGATNATLYLPSIQASGAGDYRVLVFNDFGSAASSNATITLSGYPPSIVVQPRGVTVFPRTNVTFSVLAYSTDTITYQWRSNGVNLLGATGANYTITNVQPYHQADYTVAVSDAMGANVSAVARLTLITQPVFTLQPTNRVLTLSSPSTNVTMAGAAASSTPVRYQWLYNGEVVPNATNGTQVFSNITVSSSGDYSVVASDSYGVATSAVARLTVAMRPTILQQPQPSTVVAGQDAVFSVTVSGTPPLSYRWQRKTSVNLTNGGGGVVIVSDDTGSTLTISSVGYLNDFDTYRVIVTNLVGQAPASSNVLLRVFYPPVLTVQPTNQFVNAGSTATVAAVVRANPEASYWWWFNETNLLLSRTGIVATNANGTNVSLVVSNFQATNEGLYTLVLSNQYGVTTSTGATLALRQPPTILVQPQSQTSVVGGTATFSLVVTGTPPFRYAWRFNGTNLPAALGTNAALVLANVQTNQAGDYSVVVTNLSGSVTSTVATLTVFQATTITEAAYDPLTGNIKFSFVTVPGSTYIVEYKDALDDPSWQTLRTIPGDGTVKTIEDPVRQPPPSQRFYRVRTQ
jgi:hypothetical protein